MTPFRVVLLVVCVQITLGKHRIINGNEALPGQFPYQVSLRHSPITNHRCGGSIISNKHILTAAHCVNKLIKDPNIEAIVVVGTTNLHSGGKSHKVRKIMYHTYYNPIEIYHDIAIIQICGLIQFNNITKPISLQISEIKFHSILVVIGWGCTKCSLKGLTSEKLMYNELLVVENGYCQYTFGSVLEDTIICVANKCNQGVCAGDSGGPLVYQGRQAGIVSFGKNCAPCAPDVVTKVSNYIYWIEGTMTNLSQT